MHLYTCTLCCTLVQGVKDALVAELQEESMRLNSEPLLPIFAEALWGRPAHGEVVHLEALKVLAGSQQLTHVGRRPWQLAIFWVPWPRVVALVAPAPTCTLSSPDHP